MDLVIVVLDLLFISLDPFHVVLVLREIDIQLIFSRRCRRRRRRRRRRRHRRRWLCVI